jgi:hypothetical protein
MKKTIYILASLLTTAGSVFAFPVVFQDPALWQAKPTTNMDVSGSETDFTLTSMSPNYVDIGSAANITNIVSYNIVNPDVRTWNEGVGWSGQNSPGGGDNSKNGLYPLGTPNTIGPYKGCPTTVTILGTGFRVGQKVQIQTFSSGDWYCYYNATITQFKDPPATNSVCYAYLSPDGHTGNHIVFNLPWVLECSTSAQVLLYNAVQSYYTSVSPSPCAGSYTFWVGGTNSTSGCSKPSCAP